MPFEKLDAARAAGRGLPSVSDVGKRAYDRLYRQLKREMGLCRYCTSKAVTSRMCRKHQLYQAAYKRRLRAARKGICDA